MSACTCHVVEDPWTYYGIVEPGGAMEPDPDCPVHFPPDATVIGNAEVRLRRCESHDLTLPCGGCLADHLAGEHTTQAHPECPRCATPQPRTEAPETDAAMLAAADDTLTEGENR